MANTIQLVIDDFIAWCKEASSQHIVVPPHPRVQPPTQQPTTNRTTIMEYESINPISTPDSLNNSNICDIRRKKGLLKELPDTLHELVQLAITDARAVLRVSRKLYMSAWISLQHNTGSREYRCIPCLAGAVMLRSLEKLEVAPGPYAADPINRKLGALNSVRQGHWTGALLGVYSAKVAGDLYRKHPIFSTFYSKSLRGIVYRQEFDEWVVEIQPMLDFLKEHNL